MTTDEQEIQKFDKLAQTWWDPQGPFRTLHAINPVRTQFITEYWPPKQKKILDIGCGGGILSESLAKKQALVTGIDASAQSIAIAKEHSQNQGLSIKYACIENIPSWANLHPAYFDGVVCMELLEHVENPARLIEYIAFVLKPGGACFFSTISRSLWAYLTVILAGEYVLGLLPKGTHHYTQFIQPAELARWARDAHIHLDVYQGMTYNPITHQAFYASSVSANYLAYGRKRP